MYKIKSEETYTGNPASFTGKAGDTIGSLTAAITPVQDLHGYDHPWPAGGGVNKWDEVWEHGSIDNNTGQDKPASTGIRGKNYIPVVAGESYYICNLDADNPVRCYYYDSDYGFVSSTAVNNSVLTIPSGVSYMRIRSTGTYGNVYKNDWAVNYPATVTTYSPYSNICPITGWTGANIYVSPTQNQADATTYTSDWNSAAGTVYAGSYDAVSGKLKARPQYAAYNGEELVGPWLSSMDVYEEGTTPTTGAQVVDLGGTETEYTLTPQTVAALVGQNYVWSDLNSTTTVSVLSDSPFYSIATDPKSKTRIRIYFIDATIDCTDDDDVQTNGTLMCVPGEPDSNSLIDSSNGMTIFDVFNKDTDFGIGAVVSSSISCSFLNLNSSLNGFTFGRCKIYADVYDSNNEVWIPCPLGVYYFDIPVKRKVKIISASGYDQMYLLDTNADSWWNGLDWSGGVTIAGIIHSMVATLGISLNANALTNIVNGSLSFTEAPFKSVERTFRDILQFVAEATATIAMFDRDGALDFRWFSNAELYGATARIDTDIENTPCLSIDVAEYSVPSIDQLVVKASDADVGASVGTGDNQYPIINNPFLGGSNEAEIVTKATPIYNRISSLASFSPINIKMVSDFAIEAGDIVDVVYNGITYSLPIFQQTLTWRGGYVCSTAQSSGEQRRKAQTASRREEFRSKTLFHEYEVTLEALRSRIESINGNYTQIEQTVNAIAQTVSAQGTTIQNILDPTGEIWTAITTNSTNLGAVENALNAEITERKSYIRFIPAEPAIVLGVDTGNEIKLKLANDKIWFFNGEDDSTDLSLAFAYFNSQEVYARRFVGGDSVQIGTNDDTNHWIWKKLSNGDLVLDIV